jgi:glycosyltransferase involved in cell wall biosynthesis
MKLLICTQKVDRQDITLGFFHRWIIEFAQHFESVTVICLYEGEHDLPANVKVLSLGKERGKSHPKYILRFYKYILREIGNYDKVLVHMNQEYILLGGLLWKLFRKKVYMWRNHYDGTWLTDVAAVFCSKVFCTSRFSYTAKYKKTILMPVGIDTDFFKSNQAIKRIPQSILSQGRISPSKNIHIFIEVLGCLKGQGKTFTASIYGDPLPKDAEYYSSLKKRVQELGLSNIAKFYPALRYRDLPDVYSNLLSRSQAVLYCPGIVTYPLTL